MASAVRSSAALLRPGVHSTSIKSRRATCSSVFSARGILGARTGINAASASRLLTWRCSTSAPRVATRSHDFPDGVATSLRTANPLAASRFASKISRKSDVCSRASFDARRNLLAANPIPVAAGLSSHRNASRKRAAGECFTATTPLEVRILLPVAHFWANFSSAHKCHPDSSDVCA